MRPLMELVGQEGGEAHEEEERPEQIPVVPGLEGYDDPYDEHKGKAREAVVAVGVDEVVADYPFRVDVVLAERLDEVGPEDRGVVRTEVAARKCTNPERKSAAR